MADQDNQIAQTGLIRYYRNISQLSLIERENLDLSKPFKIYSHNIRISAFEKLNLLERETVGLYQKKLIKMK